MPTAYTHAHRFTATTDGGAAAPNAAYNNLALMTVGLLVRYSDGTQDAALWSKGSSTTALGTLMIGGDGRTDFAVARSSGSSLWRGGAITVDNTWRWVFFTLNRSTGAHTRHGGPKGGTIASISVTDILSGGTVDSDSAQNFSIGTNGANNSARILEIAFSGIWDSLLSVANAQAVADDLSTATQPVAAWKPDAGSVSSIANYISGPPSMTITGASLVTGPDTGGGGADFATFYRNQLLHTGIV